MTALKSKLKESYILVFSTLAVVLILSLSAFSIHIFIRKQNISSKVLGTTFNKKEKDFWIEFLAEHPYYYPGWKRLSEISYDENDIKLQIHTKSELIKLKPIEE